MSKLVAVAESRVLGKGGTGVVDVSKPYYVRVTITGTETMLLHRYDVENVKAQSRAKKGSVDKRVDNTEAYVYRNDSGDICFPGLNFKAALCEAAKFAQDPRSPRKSARDLFRAGIRVRGLSSFGKKTWDMLDVRKVVIQRNAVPRTRPAMLSGWALAFFVEVLLPEYISPTWLNEVAVNAGRIVGLGDFRPDFGTFMITTFEVV